MSGQPNQAGQTGDEPLYVHRMGGWRSVDVLAVVEGWAMVRIEGSSPVVVRERDLFNEDHAGRIGGVWMVGLKTPNVEAME